MIQSATTAVSVTDSNQPPMTHNSFVCSEHPNSSNQKLHCSAGLSQTPIGYVPLSHTASLLVIHQQNDVAILIHKMCTQQSTNHLLRLTKSHCCRAGISILNRKLRYRIVPTRPLKQYLHPNGFTFTNCFSLSAEFARIQPMQAISCRY